MEFRILFLLKTLSLVISSSLSSDDLASNPNSELTEKFFPPRSADYEDMEPVAEFIVEDGKQRTYPEQQQKEKLVPYNDLGNDGKRLKNPEKITFALKNKGPKYIYQKYVSPVGKENVKSPVAGNEEYIETELSEGDDDTGFTGFTERVKSGNSEEKQPVKDATHKEKILSESHVENVVAKSVPSESYREEPPDKDFNIKEHISIKINGEDGFTEMVDPESYEENQPEKDDPFHEEIVDDESDEDDVTMFAEVVIPEQSVKDSNIKNNTSTKVNDEGAVIELAIPESDVENQHTIDAKIREEMLADEYGEDGLEMKFAELEDDQPIKEDIIKEDSTKLNYDIGATDFVKSEGQVEKQSSEAWERKENISTELTAEDFVAVLTDYGVQPPFDYAEMGEDGSSDILSDKYTPKITTKGEMASIKKQLNAKVSDLDSSNEYDYYEESRKSSLEESESFVEAQPGIIQLIQSFIGNETDDKSEINASEQMGIKIVPKIVSEEEFLSFGKGNDHKVGDYKSSSPSIRKFEQNISEREKSIVSDIASVLHKEISNMQNPQKVLEKGRNAQPNIALDISTIPGFYDKEASKDETTFDHSQTVNRRLQKSRDKMSVKFDKLNFPLDKSNEMSDSLKETPQIRESLNGFQRIAITPKVTMTEMAQSIKKPENPFVGSTAAFDSLDEDASKRWSNLKNLLRLLNAVPLMKSDFNENPPFSKLDNANDLSKQILMKSEMKIEFLNENVPFDKYDEENENSSFEDISIKDKINKYNSKQKVPTDEESGPFRNVPMKEKINKENFNENVPIEKSDEENSSFEDMSIKEKINKNTLNQNIPFDESDEENDSFEDMSMEEKMSKDKFNENVPMDAYKALTNSPEETHKMNGMEVFVSKINVPLNIFDEKTHYFEESSMKGKKDVDTLNSNDKPHESITGPFGKISEIRNFFNEPQRSALSPTIFKMVEYADNSNNIHKETPKEQQFFNKPQPIFITPQIMKKGTVEIFDMSNIPLDKFQEADQKLQAKTVQYSHKAPLMPSLAKILEILFPRQKRLDTLFGKIDHKTEIVTETIKPDNNVGIENELNRQDLVKGLSAPNPSRKGTHANTPMHETQESGSEKTQNPQLFKHENHMKDLVIFLEKMRQIPASPKVVKPLEGKTKESREIPEFHNLSGLQIRDVMSLKTGETGAYPDTQQTKFKNPKLDVKFPEYSGKIFNDDFQKHVEQEIMDIFKTTKNDFGEHEQQVHIKPLKVYNSKLVPQFPTYKINENNRIINPRQQMYEIPGYAKNIRSDLEKVFTKPLTSASSIQDVKPYNVFWEKEQINVVPKLTEFSTRLGDIEQENMFDFSLEENNKLSKEPSIISNPQPYTYQTEFAIEGKNPSEIGKINPRDEDTEGYIRITPKLETISEEFHEYPYPHKMHLISSPEVEYNIPLKSSTEEHIIPRRKKQIQTKDEKRSVIENNSNLGTVLENFYRSWPYANLMSSLSSEYRIPAQNPVKEQRIRTMQNKISAKDKREDMSENHMESIPENFDRYSWPDISLMSYPSIDKILSKTSKLEQITHQIKNLLQARNLKINYLIENNPNLRTISENVHRYSLPHTSVLSYPAVEYEQKIQNAQNEMYEHREPNLIENPSNLVTLSENFRRYSWPYTTNSINLPDVEYGIPSERYVKKERIGGQNSMNAKDVRTDLIENYANLGTISENFNRYSWPHTNFMSNPIVEYRTPSENTLKEQNIQRVENKMHVKSGLMNEKSIAPPWEFFTDPRMEKVNHNLPTINGKRLYPLDQNLNEPIEELFGMHKDLNHIRTYEDSLQKFDSTLAEDEKLRRNS